MTIDFCIQIQLKMPKIEVATNIAASLVIIRKYAAVQILLAQLTRRLCQGRSFAPRASSPGLYCTYTR